MIKAPSILTRLTTWRRGSALVGIVALALLNISSAAHQFEHAAFEHADHDFAHASQEFEHADDHDAEHHAGFCETCSAYKKLDDTAIAIQTAGHAFGASDDAVTTLRNVADRAPVTGAHRSRAPPSF